MEVDKEAEEDENGRWEVAEQRFPGSMEVIWDTAEDYAGSADRGKKLPLNAITCAPKAVSIRKPRVGEVYQYKDLLEEYVVYHGLNP